MTLLQERSKYRPWQYLRFWSVLRYVVVSIAALIALFPLYWIFVTSLLTTHNAFATTPHFTPDWDWSNYTRAWSLAP